MHGGGVVVVVAVGWIAVIAVIGCRSCHCHCWVQSCIAIVLVKSSLSALLHCGGQSWLLSLLLVGVVLALVISAMSGLHGWLGCMVYVGWVSMQQWAGNNS